MQLIPNWIKHSSTENLKAQLDSKKIRKKIKLAIRSELKLRELKSEINQTQEQISICTTDLKMFRGVAIEKESLTDEIKNKLKSNNLTFLYNEKIHSFVVGLEIGDIKLKNENMIIPELDDLDLIVKLVLSGVDVQNYPHTYILSKE